MLNYIYYQELFLVVTNQFNPTIKFCYLVLKKSFVIYRLIEISNPSATGDFLNLDIQIQPLTKVIMDGSLLIPTTPL